MRGGRDTTVFVYESHAIGQSGVWCENRLFSFIVKKEMLLLSVLRAFANEVCSSPPRAGACSVLLAPKIDENGDINFANGR